MFRQFMLGKLHQCRVTRADLEYIGSVAIDSELMDIAGILPYEKILIINLENGARFESYAIEAPRGSKTIGMNGGCAHLASVGDRVLIVAFAHVQEGEEVNPRTVIIGENNEIEAVIDDHVPVPVLSMESVA